jgi:tripartite-type tricarboxylate transporter receptor subunit TctC
MIKQVLTRNSVIAVAALAAGAVALPSIAQALDLKGKKVEVIVPYREGGGTDTYVRLIVPYLEKDLPGKPKMLIRNFPGGGSIKGSNKFEARAKPNGETIVATSSSTMVSQMFGGSKRKLDMLKWRQIIVSPRGTIIYFHKRTGVTGKDIVADIKKLKGQKLRYGAKKANAGELRSILAFELLGLPVQSIFGLSRGKARKAMMRGEIEVNHDTAGTYLKKVAKLEKKGTVVSLFTLGYPKGDKIIRDPAFPNMLTVGEVYQKINGKAPSGPNWEALKAFLNLGVAASKGLALPKGTSDEILNAYVGAMKKVIKDKDFQKRAKKLLGGYPQVLGKDAGAAVKGALDLDPKVDKWLKKYLLDKFNVKA